MWKPINMKSLFSLILVSSVSFAVCGSESSVSVITKTQEDVVTYMPKWLEGATITISKKDGTSEVVKAEDYMVVPRKHKRPVVEITNTETQIVCKKIEDKNIVSIQGRDGFNGDVKVKTTKTPSGASAQVDMNKTISPGVGYQRKVGPLWLGVDLSTSKNVGASVGVGF